MTMGIILIAIAPVLQIICCAVRIYRHGKIPIAVITLVCVLLGIGLSVAGGELTNREILAGMPHGRCKDCVMVGIAEAYTGLCINILVLPVIGLIATVIYSYNKRATNTCD